MTQKYQFKPDPSIYTSPSERQSKLRMKTLPLFVLMVFLSGCGSTANQTNNANKTLKPWFCQSSQDNEDWDCVRSESLVRNPRTATLKRRKVQENPSQQTSRTDTQITTEPKPEEKATRTEYRSKGLDSKDTPDYVRLAYSTEEEISLLELPKTLWAVQLIALSKKEALEDYANQTQLLRLSGARIASKNQLLYVLLLGIYESKELARQAIASLPKDQKKTLSPWIRSMGSLQTAMILGDQLALD